MMLGLSIYKFIEEVFSYPRSITGEGVRNTLYKIKDDHLPSLDIYEIPTGSDVEDWTIPKEWNIHDAFIKDSKGTIILSFADSNLHVVGYSLPVNKKIGLDELKEHLHTMPNLPSAIPYVTSYYDESWGFCMAHNQYETLTDQEYHVMIDSTLEEGHLTYADILIEGKEKEEIFISTYICHPSMANNELSGPAVATYLAKWLLDRSNRFSYRICFVPETIGSIAYISRNTKELEKVHASFNLTCLGDSKAHSFLPSRKGNTITDRCVRHCIKYQQQEYKEYSFLKDRGSDERQYCSPGVDLPMVSIMKSKYGEYPEYHTSEDDLDFISPEGLEDSFRIHTECFEILENNFKYKTLIRGEPFLSKRGRNYKIIGGIENDKSKSAQLILDLLSLCDGKNDLIEMAERIGVYALNIISLMQSLEKEGLIEKI